MNEQGNQWAEILSPLTEVIVNRWTDFLPKLVYPIRVGEHTNTAFGLSLAHDYASGSFLDLINQNSSVFYITDKYKQLPVFHFNAIFSFTGNVHYIMNPVVMTSSHHVFKRLTSW